MITDINWYIIPTAFLLDLMIGDPRTLPHPVVFMGKAIEKSEVFFRTHIKREFLSGLVFAIFLIISTWVIAFSLVRLALFINPIFADIVQTILLFFCFSAKSLSKAATEVAIALDTGGLKAGQKAVSMIVGRETHRLDEAGVVKASVETVAENFVDGFLSPLFFAMLGGVPLALAYKMVNTLDSMVGYKNERYLFFGRAAARIDDIANFIPARLSVAIIFIATTILSTKKGWQALKTGIAEGRRHKSPNSGYPEASFAGALGVRLGGPNFYHGTLVEKPFIGTRFKDPVRKTITRACELMLLSSLVSTIIATLIKVIF